MNKYEELRPCLVGRNHKRALFHKWIDKSEIVEPSIMVGGHSGGTVRCTFGLVECENGSIELIYPHNIRFIDELVKDYYKEHATYEHEYE